MKKFLKICCLLSAVFFSGVLFATSDFDSSIKNITPSGIFRFTYINVDPDIAGAKGTSAAAISGQVKLETRKWNNIQFAISPYFVEKLSALSGDESKEELNGDFFDSKNNSFSYLAEAYVNYDFENGSVRFGRQQLDNPFINTDDIRVHSNTFEAGWLNYEFSDVFNIELGKVNRWAGLDSGGSQNLFKEASNDGVTALGLHYNMKKHHVFQLWQYNFDKKYNLTYFDTNYTNGDFEAGLQYSNYNEKNASGIDGAAYGINVAYSFDKLSLNAAANKTDNKVNKSVDLGLGGGNYFASMDEMTISGITDVTAYVVGASYNLTKSFTISVAKGYFKNASDTTDINETDLVFNYAVNDHADVEFTYAKVEDAVSVNDVSTNFNRQFLRFNYHF